MTHTDRRASSRARQPGRAQTAHTAAGSLMTELVIATFRLNERLTTVAQHLAAEGGLTAAWWQVLGGVLDEPRTVAGIGRRMGMSRQGVQRVADVLVSRGLAEYRSNPDHRRAHLLAPTGAGRTAVDTIAEAQRPWANAVGEALSLSDLRKTIDTVNRVIEVLEHNQ